MAFSALAGGQWQASQLPESCIRQPVTLHGVISDFPVVIQQREGRYQQQFLLRLTEPPKAAVDCELSGVVRLSYWQPHPELTLGQPVRVEASLRPAPSQWSPGSIPDQALAAARRIFVRGTARSVTLSTSSASGRGDAGNHPGRLAATRAEIVRAIDNLTAWPRVRATLAALVVGNGAAIRPDDWARLQRLGLSHVWVISGLHIGLVFAGVWWLVQRLLSATVIAGTPSALWFSAGLSLSAAAGYSALAGFAVPTQRAVVMLATLMLARLLGWRARGRDALLLALALIVANNAHAVLGRSLWMSAGATAVLLWLARHQPAAVTPSLLLRLWQALRLQALLVLLMAPLSLFWFGQLSLLTVVNNLLFVPIMGLLIIPLGLLGAVGSVVSPVLSKPPWALAAALLTMLLPLLDNIDDRYGSSGVLRANLTLPSLRRSPAELSVLDVGQGLAVMWREGDRALLFDTGASAPEGFSQADKVILPFVSHAGVEKLETLVLSHADNDHSGGGAQLRQRLEIDQQLGFEGQPCRPGWQWHWRDGSRFTVLNGALGGRADNPGSCVLLIEYRGWRFLITGDVDKTRERSLVRYWREQLRADVLVVAHHGSDTSSSSTFLKWVDPSWSVISAARASRFGHPASAVVERLAQQGTVLLSTAEFGAIGFRVTRDGDLQVHRQRESSAPYWLQLP